MCLFITCVKNIIMLGGKWKSPGENLHNGEFTQLLNRIYPRFTRSKHLRFKVLTIFNTPFYYYIFK